MKPVKIYEDECVDLLTKNQYKIIQKKKGFRFSLDSVLLANFCRLQEGDKIIDLGTGSAIIPLIIITYLKNCHITGVEILRDISLMAQRSIELNNLEPHISIINDDLKKIKDRFPVHSFNVVISNPPYHPVGEGNINPDRTQAIARHEIACTLEDLVKTAYYLLKDDGRFFIVYKPQRIFELFSQLEHYRFHISRIRFVHPNVNERAKFVLVECLKKGKKIPEIMKPLIIYEKEGIYSQELKEIYFS
ncbi:MAG: tRNA1(Val) (adenine(37)-N6)-methyltransferase [Candidatus Firestonebacteria bacterium]|nr:tRNA1(Val) (adenine(37)-N6)-methyltransferase [Candidatus Firestonebacteria bacterium]